MQPTEPIEEEEPDPDARDARDATPAEAATLAGMIASPSLYDPIQNPEKALERRDLVLDRMLEQKMISRGQYEEAIRTAPLDEDEVDPPDVESEQPYFTSWMTEHLLRQYKPALVFGGGLKVKTTIDPELQTAAENAIAGRLAGVGPSASLVAIQNRTGEVKAMVGGTDFDARPFNLATNGHRQPGSAFKPFILVRALEDGIDPNSTWASQPKELPFTGAKGPELFKVNNYEDSYLGAASLWSATAASDNSVFAELGMEVKPKRVARLAMDMGIRTDLSTNPAMLLGGLTEGVTPLEMAYAYSTLANNGERRSSTLAPDDTGPVAIERVEAADGSEVEERELVKERVFPAKVGQLAKEMLSLVVTSGTGKAAQVGDEDIWGKTGTTENYGDAWFVGGNDELTVAVWVGYADKVQSMEYEHAGRPGGRRHLPGRDLQRLHVLLGRAARRAPGRARRRGRRRRDRGLHARPARPSTPTPCPRPSSRWRPPRTTAAAARRPTPRRPRPRRRGPGDPRHAGPGSAGDPATRPRAARAAAAPRRARPSANAEPAVGG